MKIKIIILIFLYSFIFGTSYYIDYTKIKNNKDLIKTISFIADKVDYFSKTKENSFKQNLYSLIMGYKYYIKGVDVSYSNIFIILNNHQKILYNDHLIKNYNQLINNSDIKDIFHDKYITNSVIQPVERYFNPGRYRNQQFLKYIYGSTKKKVIKNLVKIDFFDQKIYFNKNNKAAIALLDIRDELQKLLIKYPSYIIFFKKIEGTFNYRKIRNSSQLSAHAYGIAIDLHLKKPYYWQQFKLLKKNKHNRVTIYTIPNEIVKIFEKNHFIWGGKWYHFDTIHFEYRPEFFYHFKKK